MGDQFRTGRSAVYAQNGMAATSQPYATLAALNIMQNGGNAIDAAVAAAAVLNVVEPHSTGIGGDVFALFWWAETGELKALNGSGRAPAAATIEEYRKRGHSTMPFADVLSVTTPGTVDGWARLLEEYGRMDFAKVLAPAIPLAEQGFAVSPVIGKAWAGEREKLLRDPDAARSYLVDGRAPSEGDLVRNPALGRTFRILAEGGRDAFYRDELGEMIVRSLQEKGGLLTMEDLKAHRSDWVDPISTTFHGYEVFEIPPNGQGLTALLALNILENEDFSLLEPESADYYHLILETMKLAFADRDFYIADPGFTDVPVERLLSKEYAAERRKLIDPRRALPDAAHGRARGGDTVYLATADADGNMVSFINSIYSSFGSGICAGNTGIMMQNRAAGYVLDDDHPRRLEPGKRPFHTIIPGFLMKDGHPLMAFGVMGADMQPQGHVQLLLNHLEFGMDLQEAVEAQRVRFISGNQVWVEDRIPAAVAQNLVGRGHAVYRVGAMGFGGAQAIARNPQTGVYTGASESRKDGCAMGY